MACSWKYSPGTISRPGDTTGPASSQLLPSVTKYQIRYFSSRIMFISNRATGILESHDLRLQDVSNITLLLPSLAPEIFATANKAYAEFFGVSPPSRACVGVDLPQGVHVMLECIAHKENSDIIKRKALHVQGLSYWAPANIGPYSQAVTVRSRLFATSIIFLILKQVEPYVFVSGQIGLLPPSLTLPSPPSLALETALVFQHTDRVVRAANCEGGHVLLLLYWLVDEADVLLVRRACEHFNEVSREFKHMQNEKINFVGIANAFLGRCIPPARCTCRETGLGTYRLLHDPRRGRRRNVHTDILRSGVLVWCVHRL